jgi:site-specific recombinase XerD
MQGASASEIASILGHKTLQMVKRYSHISEAHSSAVLERMNSKYF